MPRGRKKAAAVGGTTPIEQYEHVDKTRLNNPPAGLAGAEPAAEEPRKRYQHDPHLDPQLVWAGKAEGTAFDVPTVALHVHERIDPRTILESARRAPAPNAPPEQPSLFETKPENPPLREAVEFYQHAHNWSNRLIAGDSLLVMNSLLEKEGMAGQVQMIYLDPPYGIRYGSNFQAFVNKRDVKDNKDEDLTQEPEMIRAFRDTWELGIHSYLTYLRDRLLLARELLTESGSIFVQISDENLHHVREIMDDVFGPVNFCSVITVKKTTGAGSPAIGTDVLPAISDYILWYARSRPMVLYEQLYWPRAGSGWVNYDYLLPETGTHRRMEPWEKEPSTNLPPGSRVYRRDNLTSTSTGGEASTPIRFAGKDYAPGRGGWKTSKAGIEKLALADRLEAYGETLAYRRFADDFPFRRIPNLWDDTVTGGYAEQRFYVVQTNLKIVERCLMMTTNPGDIVLDPTCGSGTTAYVAEKWGRRWITCDTSRVAIALAKQRLMTAGFDYYELARPEEGVGSGFRYKTVPHVTLKSIANNPEIRPGMTREQIDAAIAKYADTETLYDQPLVDHGKGRVTGPFTVEAVPAPAVLSLHEIGTNNEIAGGGDAAPTAVAPLDASVARGGATARYAEWRDELLKTGFRGKGGQKIDFSRVEAQPALRWLHAAGETKGDTPERVAISFGPEHGPLEQRQVAAAIEEAHTLVPRPTLLIFAAFQFDPEAAKEIAEIRWPGVTLLQAQMNTDLLTHDLKKKRSNNQSFWLIGQPDIAIEKVDSGQFQVAVQGFDYYNTRTGAVDSGDISKIAMWMLDTDYDGRSLFPRQVFFPMADEKGGWGRLAKQLRADIDPELIEAYRGGTSLPFVPGPHRRAAVKIIDDRGIESLRVVGLE